MDPITDNTVIPFEDLGNYVVFREGKRQGVIGRGGSGNVYIARHRDQQGQENPRDYVALKLIRINAENALGIREAAAVKHYQALPPSPYLIHILDSDITPCESHYWYTMPLADDADESSDIHLETYVPKTLSTRMAARPIPARECLEIGQRICEGILALEARAHAHLDLKPSNIIYIDNVVRIADIGLITTRQNQSPLINNPYYLFYGDFFADETQQNLMDLSALGALLHQLLNRSERPPRVLLKPGAPPSDEPDPGVWHALHHIASRAHNDNPRSFKTVREMADALEALARGKYVIAQKVSLRKRLALVSALLLVVSLVALLIDRASTRPGIGPVADPIPKPDVTAELPFKKWRDVVATPYKDLILLSGGGYDFHEGLNIFYAYDPARDTYLDLGPLPDARLRHGLLPVGDTIYLFGGQGSAQPKIHNDLASTLRYDPATDTYREGRPMPYPGTMAGAVFHDDRILVIISDPDRPMPDHPLVHLYDPKQLQVRVD
ncbi:MAG: protein kinase, partial [Verrucomicrobiota bacterium]